MAAMIRDETRILSDVGHPPTRTHKELGLAAAPDRGGEEEAVAGLGEPWCARATHAKGPRAPRAPPARSGGGRAHAPPPPPPPPPPTPSLPPGRRAVRWGGVSRPLPSGAAPHPSPLPPMAAEGMHARASLCVVVLGGCDARGASTDGRTGEAVCHTGAVLGPLRVARWWGGLRPALASPFPNHVPLFCCLAGGSLSLHPPKPSQPSMAFR